MQLTLMRHGEPERDSLEPTDPGLAESAWGSVRAAARLLARESAYSAVYASPQRRAAQTASVVGSELDLPIGVESGVVEFDYGAPYVHYDDAGAQVWRRYFAGDLTPWGTTATQFHDRIAKALNVLAQRHMDGKALVVCHGGVINAWSCQVLAVPERIRVVEPGYASLHRYEHVHGNWRLVSLNEVAPVTIDSEDSLALE